MATETFYPAVGANSPVDGYCEEFQTSGVTWATIRGGTGNYADDDQDTIRGCNIQGGVGGGDQFRYLGRGIVLFDVSSINGTTAIGAVMSLYGSTKVDDLIATPDINIYESRPANNNAIVTGDFDSLQAVALCDAVIAYGSFNTGTPGTSNDFTLNAAGLTLLQTAMDGSTVVKLGTRNVNYDVSGDVPNNPGGANKYSYLRYWSADKGAGYRPKLVVTYSVGWAGGGVSGVAIAAIAKINGVALADITKVNGVS